ncbi:MAG TPA: hypothetical protein VNV88_16360, partial [Candidatus Solibacter sp.]|nr:hypothetical protein [Candidatus Solibacter sp.]
MPELPNQVHSGGLQRGNGLMIQRKAREIIFSRERRSRRLWMPLLRILVVGVSLIAAAQQNQRNNNKVSNELAEKHQRAMTASVFSDEMVDVIVQFKHPPDNHHFDKVKGFGGSVTKRLASVKGGAFRLPLSVVRSLADDPEVAYISTDRIVRPSSTDRYIQAVGADYANSMGWTGSGITVAVIDSGISYHDDLYHRVIY